MKSLITKAWRGVGLAVLVAPTVWAQDCETWLERFTVCDLNGAINASLVWDDGSGEALFAGGEFTATGSGTFPLGAVARWHGGRWEQLGPGIDLDQPNHRVFTMTTFDDGSGRALYVGGAFATVDGAAFNAVARWDGHEWTDLAGGLTGNDGASGYVRSMLAFDDGSGPRLYVWGAFEFAGGVPAHNFARWDGFTWEGLNDDLGNGSSQSYLIRDMTAYDDGSGAAIYAGGNFTTTAGHLASAIAKWTGTGWAPVGGGFPTFRNNDDVYALLVADLGDGPRLVGGGDLETLIDGHLSESVVAWNGQAWESLGDGLANSGSGGAVVQSLAVSDAGGQTLLYAGGQYDALWMGAGKGISAWDGIFWLPVAYGVEPGATQLQTFDRGDGDRLWLLGRFGGATGVPSPNLIGWDGQYWDAAGDGLPGTNGFDAMAVFDDGTGAALFAGSSYNAGTIGRLDPYGWTWYPEVRSYAAEFEVVDLGNGPALYAALPGTSGIDLSIARLDNDVWQRVGESLFTAGVNTLEMFDDGAGPRMYAGGGFSGIWSTYTPNAALWSQAGWREMDGLDDPVRDWVVFDDGSGDAIYAVGTFDTVNGAGCRGVARWRDSSWECVGGGLNWHAYAVEVFDDGGGPALYVAGRFFLPGSNGNSVGMARWNGSAWEPLGDGLGNGAIAYALRVFDDGTGSKLYVGGAFTTAGGQTARGIARWSGSAWEPVGTGTGINTGDVRAIAVFNDGAGPRLAAAGTFTSMDGILCGRIAAWDGLAWSPLGSGMESTIWTLTTFDDGGGDRLYAGGKFQTADGRPAYLVASWDGVGWSAAGALDNRNSKSVEALEVFDDGSGPRLYAGGSFGLADGLTVKNFASWDGSEWSRAPGTNNTIYSLNALTYQGADVLGMGGSFWLVGAEDFVGIAKLDGTKWVGVPNSGLDEGVSDLLAFDDGTGPALYVAGGFLQPGERVAKFDGAQWHRLGDGFNAWVHALEVFDSGSGPGLYAAGEFTSTGGATALHLARWDGNAWSQVGGGIDDGICTELKVHQGPAGPWLVVLGTFTSVGGGLPSRGVAAWDGSQWVTFDPGLDGGGRAALSIDEGDGPALLIGGNFDRAGDTIAGGMALWGPCPPPPCYADFNDDGAVNTLDVLAFLNAWVAGDLDADMNGDGVVNTLDVLAFLNYWTAGC